jgi:hypothetical protein
LFAPVFVLPAFVSIPAISKSPVLPLCPACAAYGLALVWAFVAVYEKTESVAVRNSALGAIVLLAILSIASVLRRPGQEPHFEPVGTREPLRPSQDES